MFNLTDIGWAVVGLIIYMGVAFGLAFILNWHFNKIESRKGGK